MKEEFLMSSVFVAALVICFVAYLIYKKYKPQTVILLGGMILLAWTIIIGKPLIPKGGTGSNWLDIFKLIENITSTRIAGLGIMIMSCTGFVKYMDYIGASQRFVEACVRPLRFIKSPYAILPIAYIIGQIMKMAITSAAGLGILLMSTMFPLLRGIGVSAGAAAAVIVTATCIDLGPAAGTSNLIAKTANISPVTYFSGYQLKIAVPVIILIAVMQYFVNKFWDKKEGYKPTPESFEHKLRKEEVEHPTPFYYTILPIVPLITIFVFSPVIGSKLNITLVAAMYLGMFVAMVCEYLRYRNLKLVFKSIQEFFDGMGGAFATIVSLVIAGETFAAGLTLSGAIGTVLDASKAAGFDASAMTILLEAVVAGSAILTGSGDASMFSFAGLAPTIAEHSGSNPVALLLPMQFAATMGRAMSPISAVVLAVSGIAALSPTEVAKRTFFPMLAAIVATSIAVFMLM